MAWVSVGRIRVNEARLCYGKDWHGIRSDQIKWVGSANGEVDK